ncbi:hypothetical protein VM247_004549 [Salmonella enterica]|nr:hypothetical protein [Salmonella enterica]EMC8988206.1 hypothetical protein [Salmonella enterica]
MMSTKPTNDELSANFANQIEAATKARQADELKRLERAGRAAAAMDERDAEQKQEEMQAASNQAKNIAKELNADNEKGDQVKEARKRDLMERFKEKAARDRENERSGRAL